MTHSVQSVRAAGDMGVITSEAHLDCVRGGISQDSPGKWSVFPLESLNVLGEML